MANEKLYRPAAPFVWIDEDNPDDPSPSVLHEGMIFKANHPAVKQKRACFVEVTEDNTIGRIETARANPGENSAARRPQ